MASQAIDFDYEAVTTTPTQSEPVCQTTVTHFGLAQILIEIQGYCQAVFEELAARSPNELCQIVRDSQAPITRLTYAAEILGRDVATRSAAAILTKTLQDHPSRLVREGAVLGLEHHLERHGVRENLLRAAHDDPSPGVRRAAAEALAD